MFGIFRIDPDSVLIDVTWRTVSTAVIEAGKGLSAVERRRDRQSRDVNRLVARRIHANLAEVHPASIAIAHEGPRCPLVLGTQHAATRGVECRRSLIGISRCIAAPTATATTAAKTARRSAVVTPVEATAATATTSATLLACRGTAGSAHRSGS